MRKIIVTGASGVIGRAFLRLAADKTDMEILALSRSQNSGGDQNQKRLRWATTDYTEQSLHKLLEGASAVIHLAGIKGTRTELSEYDEDMHMTENLLKASSECGVGTFIYASSRLVYGRPENVPWTEDMIPEPASAYGMNKVRCEELCRFYSELSGMRVIAVRIAQVLSETDRMRNMVNVFRDMASEGRQLTVIGCSKTRRQYIYAGDLAEVLYRLLDSDAQKYTIINAGMENAYTNLEIAEAFNRAYRNAEPVSYDDSQPETITASVMDVGRMIRLTGYVPDDLDTVLARMAANTR